MNEGILTGLVTSLIDHLRLELRQYGEILAFLEQQQESVVTRSAEDVMQSVAAINQQMATVQEVRQQREACQNTIANTLGQKEDPTFVTLLPHLPEKFRSAVGALVRENNELLRQVRRRARQNHLLLSQSLERMRQFLTSLAPAAPPTTYNKDGRLLGRESTLKKFYEAEAVQINKLLSSIASLNQQIFTAEVARQGSATDLRDLRQQRVEELARRVDIKTAEQPGGTLDVAVAGPWLVTGTQVRDTVEACDAGDGQVLLRTQTGGTALNLADGQLQGMFEVRDVTLTALRDDLNAHAA